MSGMGRFPRRFLPVLAVIAFALLAGCRSGGGDTSALEADLAKVRDANAASDQQVAALSAQVVALSTQVAQLQAIVNPTPVPVKTFSDYGFSLPVPDGVEVRAAGIGDAQVSAKLGQLTATAGGVSMVLIWTSDDLTPQQAVQGAFEVLQASTPNLAFQPVNQGDLTVDQETGAFGAFSAFSGQQTAGIGLIGGWRCGASPTFSLTVVGTDLTAVESSFDGFTQGFACHAS